MTRILFLIVLVAVSWPLFGSIKNYDECRAEICVKIYESPSMTFSDSLEYYQRSGKILYIYRFNDRKDLLAIRFSKISMSPCGSRNGSGVSKINNDYIASGCISLNAHKSRTFSVNVRSLVTTPSRMLVKMNPTIWVRCPELIDGCDDMTSAPLQIRTLF